MPRLFHYSEEAFDRMCEGLDAFLHKTYGEPPQALEEGDTACVLCRHPMSITSPEFQFVDEAMSVHAQCACFAQMSWMPTREMLTKVVAKRKSSVCMCVARVCDGWLIRSLVQSCVQCNESTPFVTCVGCALLQNDKTKCMMVAVACVCSLA